MENRIGSMKVSRRSISVRTKRDAFLPILIGLLDNKLFSPEEVVIKQNDPFNPETTAMYFIGRGDCAVNIISHTGYEEMSIHTLEEGDHFGEVALLYQCHRSASVVSRNYNTLAVLLFQDFQLLKTEHPEFEKELTNYVISNYKDSKVEFLKKAIKSVVYLEKIEIELLTKFVFSIKPK